MQVAQLTSRVDQEAGFSTLSVGDPEETHSVSHDYYSRGPRVTVADIVVPSVAFLVGLGIVEGLKSSFSEQRPGAKDDSYLGKDPNKAFPSGHTYEITMLGMAAFRLLGTMAQSNAAERVSTSIKSAVNGVVIGMSKYSGVTPAVTVVAGLMRIAASAHYLKNVAVGAAIANIVDDLSQLNLESYQLYKRLPLSNVISPFGCSIPKFIAMSVMLGVVDAEQRGICLGMAGAALAGYGVSYAVQKRIVVSQTESAETQAIQQSQHAKFTPEKWVIGSVVVITTWLVLAQIFSSVRTANHRLESPFGPDNLDAPNVILAADVVSDVLRYTAWTVFGLTGMRALADILTE